MILVVLTVFMFAIFVSAMLFVTFDLPIFVAIISFPIAFTLLWGLLKIPVINYIMLLSVSCIWGYFAGDAFYKKVVIHYFEEGNNIPYYGAIILISFLIFLVLLKSYKKSALNPNSYKEFNTKVDKTEAKEAQKHAKYYSDDKSWNSDSSTFY